MSIEQQLREALEAAMWLMLCEDAKRKQQQAIHRLEGK